jgi:hypothetical protein
MEHHRTSGARHFKFKSPVANRVERGPGNVQRTEAGLQEPRCEERVVAGVEPVEDLPRGGRTAAVCYAPAAIIFTQAPCKHYGP